MKKSIITFFVLLLTTTAFGQSKLDLNLTRLAKEHAVAAAKGVGSAAASQQFVTVNAVLAEGAQVPTEKLAALGAKVSFSGYGIVSMLVPVGSLTALDDLDEFLGFESQKEKYVQDSKSIEVEHVDSLQDAEKAEIAGLSNTYNGDSVMVGVFDRGIDFNHVNFRDPETGATRIKKAMLFRNYTWYQGHYVDDDNNLLTPQDVIEEYVDTTDINSLTTDDVTESHGTHTTGIAAGSFNGSIANIDGVSYTGQRGTAFKADLVLAGAKDLLDSFQSLALAKMDTLATDAKEPLVVNLSIGSNGGWMDDKTVMDIFYDNFTKNGTRPGRIVCMSAGNEGDVNFTIYKKLDADNDYTVKSLIEIYPDANPCVKSVIDFFCSDTTEIDVSVDLYDNSTGQLVRTISNKELIDQNMLNTGRNIQHDNRFNGIITITVDKTWEEFGNYFIGITAKSKYNHPCYIRMFQYYQGRKKRLPFWTHNYEGFTAGDPGSSFNEDGCTNSVLTVGAWAAQNTWIDYTNQTDTVPKKINSFGVNDICSFSSYVLTDDNGYTRPDFAAPGGAVVSGYNIYDKSFFSEEGVYTKADKDFIGFALAQPRGKLYSPYGQMSGTSQACPNAVGIIALWLQANPELCINDIRDIIKHTADRDEYTDPDLEKYPDMADRSVRFGYGKINAIRGLKYILQHYPTAIHEVVDGNPKGLDEPAARKVFRNGKIVIVKGDKEYSIIGQELN